MEPSRDNGNSVTEADLLTRLEELASKYEMDYFGVAPVDRLANAPQGWSPGDILDKATSVIAMGIGISQGVRQSQRRARLESDPTAEYGVYVYQAYGYNILNDKLNLAAYAVAKELEGSGFITVPIPASPPYDVQKLVGIFSHRHTAVAAGIGEMGWNRLLLTPDRGPNLRLVSVITTAALKPSPMYSGPGLCHPDRCGRICATTCPAMALSQHDKEQCFIGDKVFEFGKFDEQHCLSAPCGTCLVLCPVGG